MKHAHAFHGSEETHLDDIDQEILQLVVRIHNLSEETKSADAALMRINKIRELVKALMPRIERRYDS